MKAIMHGQAYLTSAELAAHLGPFDGFALNRRNGGHGGHLPHGRGP